MRILIVSDIFYPHTGGVSEHMLYLWKNLRALGHDVKVLAPSFGTDEPYTDEHIYRMGRALNIPMNRSFSVITLGFSIPWQMRRLLDRERFDIIHIHGPVAPVLPYFALKYSQSKNFATFHSAYRESLGYMMWEPVLEQYFRRIHGLIAVSEVARDSMSRYFPGDYRIIPNGVDPQRFSPDVTPVKELTDYPQTVLFVGRFEPRKGLRYLLRAFPRVIKEFPEAKLVIVGKGFLEAYYRRYIQEHVKDNVVFKGYVNPEELPRYYVSCDIYCTPATGAESFGIVLLEAMASGRPIVASDIPGYRRVLDDNEQGLFFRACDPDDCAEKIITLLKDKEARARMGKNGRTKALLYDWHIITENVARFYDEVMNNSH